MVTKRPSGDEAVALRLAAILREYREPPGDEVRRFTQEEAAERIGISRNHYQRLEQAGGEKARERVENPTYSTLVAIADFVELPVTDLVLELEFARNKHPGKKQPPAPKD